MAIPEMVYQTTRILSVLSIAIEVAASIASCLLYTSPSPRDRG